MTKGTKRFKRIMIMVMLAALTLVAGLHSAGAHKDGAYSHDATIGYTNKNWMGSLPDDRLLSEMSIPGTHDTMAYQIVGPVDCLLDNNITLTQSMDLETQLNSGVRFLDIRGFHAGDILHMHHGGCDLGTDFDEVLQTVTDFLKNNTDSQGNPTETIVMKVSREDKDNERDNELTYRKVFDDTVSPYASYVYTEDDLTFSKELGALRGKIVFLGDFADSDKSVYIKETWSGFGSSQGEWELECHYDLYGKWLAVKDQLAAAASGSSYYHYVNFLSGAYSGEVAWSILTVGSCVVDPFFVASGHNKPASDANRKDTDSDDSYPATYTLYPDFPRTGCQKQVKALGIVWQKAKCDIEYEGTNILTTDYLASQTALQRVGIIVADFPGKELIEQVIRMNEPKANEPPLANLTGPNGADPYITHEGWVELDASGSTDKEGDRLQYIWDLDSDGHWETTWSYYEEKFRFFVGDDWSGTVTVAVHDNQGDADARASYDTLEVVVTNEPPTIDSFDVTNLYYYKEGDTAVIKGKWSDHLLGEPNQTYTGLALWSDEFDTRELILNEDGTFETSRKLDNILGLGNVSEDLNVEIIIYDTAGGRGSASSPDIIVSHAPPTIDAITIPARIQEGETAVVTGTFSDPVFEACDTRTYYEGTALWSDGIWTNLVANLDGTFETSRDFKDDFKLGGAAGTAEDAFYVTITIYDFCRNPTSRTSSVLTVENSPPTIQLPKVSSFSLAEGDTVTISGTFIDSALGVATETFQGRALWSDGRAMSVTVDGNAGTFSVSRQFGDVGPTPEAYTMQMVITDDDSGVSNILTTPTITVDNAPPVVDEIQVPAQPFFEGQEAVVYGSFSDPSGPESSETYTGMAEWSDGTKTELTFKGRVFRAAHVIADDNPTGTPFDDYTVDITIGDGDGGISLSKTSPAIRIRNVAPASSIDSLIDETGETVGAGIRNVLVHTTLFLDGSFTDVGALDTHTATVQWGDGRSSSGPTTGAVTVAHRYGEAGRYRIELGVVDDDTGVGTAEATIQVVESAEAIEDLATKLAGGTNGSGAVITAGIAVQRDRVTKLAAANQSADEAIQQAIAKLRGHGGALEMLAQGNTNAALVKMRQAMGLLETAEAADGTLDLTSEKQTLALAAKSTAVTAILEADDLAATRKDLTKVAHAYDLVDEADTLLAAHDFVNAVETYREAAQEVQGINGEK